MSQAFVKVNRSDMPHNEGKLFYTACRTDDAGVLWGVLDSMEYSFVWGFEKIEHALAIVDNYNDPYSEITCSALARRFKEREQSTQDAA